MDRHKPPVLRPVVWLGNSKRNLQGFPDGAQKLLGDELQLIQFGGMPKDANPSRALAAAFLRLPCNIHRTPFVSCWRSKSAGGFMFCTPFRRSRRKALEPRNPTLT